MTERLNMSYLRPLVTILLMVGFGGSLPGVELVSFSGTTMGTRYSITIAEREDIVDLQKQVDARLYEINKQMSTYDPESELAQFNQYEKNDCFPISRDITTVVEFALKVARSSDGAFDPTVGPAVNLWGFGPEGRRQQPPDPTEIEKVRQRIGYQKLEVRKDPPALRKNVSDIYVDLSAVAKGYAVDELSRLLKQAGCGQSLVVIGGEIRATDKKPDGSYWKIGIEEPDRAGRSIRRMVSLENQAVSTSGDWRNTFVHDGMRYSHVIDPSTARPVRHDLASVTVVADTGMQADAWSTALLVMGKDRGVDWCEQHDVAALFFSRTPDGKIDAHASSEFANCFEQIRATINE